MKLSYGFHWDYIFSFNLFFIQLHNKKNIGDYEIKHQLSTEVFFLDYDNLIKGKTKPIMKLNFQLI